jgi:hypothetical protein
VSVVVVVPSAEGGGSGQTETEAHARAAHAHAAATAVHNRLRLLHDHHGLRRHHGGLVHHLRLLLAERNGQHTSIRALCGISQTHSFCLQQRDGHASSHVGLLLLLVPTW